jgi:hypothetical protein
MWTLHSLTAYRVRWGNGYREGLLGGGELGKIKYTSSLIDDAEIYRETILTMISHVMS